MNIQFKIQKTMNIQFKIQKLINIINQSTRVKKENIKNKNIFPFVSKK